MRIKDIPKVDRPNKIKRHCVICGKDIFVKIFSDGKYSGGNYFGNMLIEKSTSQNTKREYWECEICFNKK